MANLYNLDNKLLVGTNGEVRIGDTATVADVKLRVKQTAQQWTAQFVNTDSSVAYGISIDTSASSYGVAGTLQCYTNSGGGFIVRNDSRVGIGTTGPSVKLDVVGSGKFQPGVADGDALVTIAQTNSNAYVHAGIKINAGNTNPFYIYQSGSSNTLRFNYNSLADAGGQLVITDSGYVGIGTAGPDAILNISKTSFSTTFTSADSYIRIGKTENATNGYQFIGFGYNNGSADLVPAYIGYQQTGTPGNYTKGDLVFGTRNVTTNTAPTERMRITGGGNIGINEDNPSTQIHNLQKTNNRAGGFYTQLNGNNYGLSMFVNSGGYGVIGSNGNFTTDVLTMDLNSGNVGIGVTAPLSPLTVKANTGGSTLRFIGRSDGISGIDFFNSTQTVGNYFQSNGTWIRSRADGGFHFSKGSTPITTDVDGFTIEGMNVGIGTHSPNNTLHILGTSDQQLKIDVASGGTFSSINFAEAGSNKAAIAYKHSTNEIQLPYSGNTSSFVTMMAGGSERMRIRSGGEVNIGSTGDFSAGKLVIQQNQSENGGILTLQNGGTHGYYTRVLHNATSTSQAGYWHIKTNIPVGGNVMFIAKFYGYIYGSAQVLDLTHAGYAYSGTNTVINQGVQNNGNNVNSSSAYYTSANGGKVCFRVAFGAGATFSTYFAGVYMDMAFPSPAGQGHDFEIEAQSFSQNTTVY